MALVERNRNPTRRDLRVFGLLLGLFGIVVGGLIWRRTGALDAAAITWGVTAAVTAAYFALPPLRWPLYMLWTTAAYPIGWAVSHLLLAIIFFALLTPFGLVMRLLGRDPMRRKAGAPDASQWRPIEPTADRGRYFRQS